MDLHNAITVKKKAKKNPITNNIFLKFINYYISNIHYNTNNNIYNVNNNIKFA
jgi:hypothetical protein